jgi:O-antigen ligase
MSSMIARAAALGAGAPLLAAGFAALVWLAVERPRAALYAAFALVPTQFIFVPVSDFFISPADVAVVACSAGLVVRLLAGGHGAWLALRLHLMLALVIAAYLVGFIVRDYSVRTLVRVPLAFVPSILACELLLDRRQFKGAIVSLIVAGLIDAGYGAYSLELGHRLHPTRFSGVMGVNFSAIMILSAAAMAFSLFARTRQPLKLLVPGGLTLFGLATLSRMGLLAFALAGVLVVWRLATRSNRRVVVAAAIGVLVIAVSQSTVRERLFARADAERQLDGLQRTSTDVRLAILRTARHAIAEDPLVGVGYFNFQAYSARDPEVQWSTAGVGYATHNTYLEVLVEGGLLAFVPFLLHFGQYVRGFRPAWIAVAHRRDTVVGAILAALLIVIVSATAANLLLHYLFWSVCGTGLACFERLRRDAWTQSTEMS